MSAVLRFAALALLCPSAAALVLFLMAGIETRLTRPSARKPDAPTLTSFPLPLPLRTRQ